MPLFQKSSNGPFAPRKSTQPAPVAPAPSSRGTAGRRSLALVGKAITDAVAHRKAPPSPKSPIRPPLTPTATNGDTPSSPSTTPSKHTIRSSKAKSSAITTPVRDNAAKPARNSPSPALKGSPVLKSRLGSAASSNMSSSSSPSSSTSLRITQVPSLPSSFSLHNDSSSSSSKPVSASIGQVSSSPSSERRSRHAPSASVVSASTVLNSSSSQTSKGSQKSSKTPPSSLPQPKSRPRSAIYIGAGPSRTAPDLTPQQTVGPSKKRSADEQAHDESVQTRGGGNKQSLRSSPASQRLVPPSSQSPPLAGRPLSPLPKRNLRPRVARNNTSESTAPSSMTTTSHVAKSPSDTDNVFSPPSGTLPLTGSSLKTSSDVPTARSPPTSGSAVSLKSSSAIGTSLPRPTTITRAQGLILATRKPSPERSLGAKRRKSEAPASISSAESSRVKPEQPAGPSRTRLSIPSSSGPPSTSTVSNSSPTKTPTTPHLPHMPTTPSNAAPTILAEHTFSIPRNRIISFTLADMDMPDIPDDENDMSHSFELPGGSSVAPSETTEGSTIEEEAEVSSLLLPSFPPIRPSKLNKQSVHSASQIRSSTPTQHANVAHRRKKRPTMRSLDTHGRQSILSWDTIVERSREYTPEDLSQMLNDVAAPFTPDIMRGTSRGAPSLGAASGASFTVNGAGSVISEMSVPPSPRSSIGGPNETRPTTRPASRNQQLPSSIAQLLFPSMSTSPPLSPHAETTSLPTRAHDPSPVETEVLELRLRLRAHESTTYTQSLRLAELENRLLDSTLRHSELEEERVVKDAFFKANSVWESVRSTAKCEVDMIASERATLKALLMGLSSCC